MKTHLLGIVVWSLVAFALYTVLSGIGGSPIVTREETALTKTCGTLAEVFPAPFFWIPPRSILGGPQAFVLMSLFWGFVLHGFYRFVRRTGRSREV